ncbi:MAG TPA: hypothetical protein VFH78_06760 [Candidatus Thermoplasmatota archaeon]|nr:hypothetical protein [Candidatus Thermoplasmatota archaeon]
MMRRDDDRGQLMMLAGIVLTISFILTALTLSQVAALEREAAAQGPLSIVNEWRFLHDRLSANLKTAIGPEMSIESFLSTILPTVQATFRAVEAEKGYDLTLRPAAGAIYDAPGNEADLAPGGTTYNAWSWNGRVRFTHAVPAVPSAAAALDDGVIWETPCPDASAPAAGCITGVYLHVRLTDGTTTLSESILFAANRP